MKRFFTLIITLFLIFTLYSCGEKKNDVTNEEPKNKPVQPSETEVVTKTEEEKVSDTEETATIPSTPEVPATSSSAPVTSTTSTPPPTTTKAPTNNDTPRDEPAVAINFVPNRFQQIGTTETYIPYSDRIFYKGKNYASVGGKNNGVDCFAIVTVGNNDEYLSCIAIFDESNNERTVFNIWNDRIYYLKHPAIGKVSTVHSSLSVCSMNLEGKDKKVEKNIDIQFTNIRGFTGYKDSKYLFFFAINPTAQDSLCRFDTETKELVTLNQSYNSDKNTYSVENKIFVYHHSQGIYEYDSSFNSEKLLFQTGSTYSINSFAASGIVLTHNFTKAKYLLDFSGNLSNL